MAQSFSSLEYENRKRTTKRDEILKIFDDLIPWDEWVIVVRPFYYKGRRGRKPVEIETMLRMYVMQELFGLSCEATEDGIYDSYAMRTFLNVDFFGENVPDATTLQRFRRLLAKNGIAERIDSDIVTILKSKNLKLKKGSTLEPKLVSTKRRPRKRKTD